MNLLRLLFSFFGRINRAKYWLGVGIVYAIFGIATFLWLTLAQEAKEWNAVFGCVMLTGVASLFSIYVKRLHDLDISGWWVVGGSLVLGALTSSRETVVSNVVSLLLCIAMIWAGSAKGNEGENRFGADPLHNVPKYPKKSEAYQKGREFSEQMAPTFSHEQNSAQKNQSVQSDIWYYSEGDKPVGPLSLADLTAILSRVASAKNLLVWRDGFEQWRRAETVTELVPFIIKPRMVAKMDRLSAKSRRARDQLDHVPRLVEKYKQAILATAFRGELTETWRTSHPNMPAVSPRAAGEIKRKFSEIGDFVAPFDVPNSWRWLRLPQIGELDRGKSRHRPRDDDRLFGGPYPFIQTGEVRQADRYLTAHSQTYSEFGLAQSRLWPIGTLCITIAANIAETAILAIDACFPDSVVGFVPDEGSADVSYVEFFLRTARADLETFAPATAQKNINLDTLAAVRVPIAPPDEQREIVRRIASAFAWIDRLASEATSAHKLVDHLDQAVLAKAFRGELVPQDPNDEPASILLERIHAERGAERIKTPARNLRPGRQSRR